MVKRYPEAIKHFSESFQILIKLIVNRIDSNKNALIPLVGSTGSGKSLSALQIAIGCYLYMFGKIPSNEYLINHLFFRAKDFLKEMNQLSQDLNEKKSLPKQFWIWDESGIEAGAKEHMTLRNRAIGWLVQTFRNLNQIVFFTVPSFSFLDASIRKMMHIVIETRGIDKKKNLCYIKPFFLQYNMRQDKIYYHNLVYPDGKGEVIVVENPVPIPRVSKELEDLYETGKNKFTSELNTKIVSLFDRMEAKNDNTPKLTSRQKEILRLLKEGVLSTNKIAEKLGMRAEGISENFNFMRRKGIDIDYYLEKRGLGGFPRKTTPAQVKLSNPASSKKEVKPTK